MNFDFKNVLIIFLLLFVFSITLNGISAESVDSNDFSNNNNINLNEMVLSESSPSNVSDLNQTNSNLSNSSETLKNSSETTKNNVSKGNNVLWMKSDTDLSKVDLTTLSKYNVNNIFLHSAIFNHYKESYIQSWILKANSYGIKIHIWMQVFYDNGKWVAPIKDNVINTTFFNKRINEAMKYASMEGVSGIHLDYLRFPGNAYKYANGTKAINAFVKDFCSKLKESYPYILISASVMPESISSDKYYYGQDIVNISQYLDVICPMVYKYNYDKTSSWIKSVTQTFVKASVHAQIWTGLQTYQTNAAETKVLKIESASELETDCRAAIEGGATGFALFRYGLINYFDFSSAYVPKKSKQVSLNDVLKASSSVKSYIANHKNTLPKTVTVGKYKVTIYQFSYLMSVAILNIKNNKKSKLITIKSISSIKIASYKINMKVSKSTYLKATTSIYNYINSNGRLPAYVKIGSKKANFKAYTWAFSRILAYYKSNKSLPSTCTISS